MTSIITTLWFDSEAEEAAKFYASIFKNSKIGRILHYDEASAKGSGKPAGSVLTVEFTLDGHKFIALNGGPMFKFNESVSLMIECKDQKEVDYYWSRLIADGGEESMCGWLKDKYGLSWQVTPTVLLKMIGDKDEAKAKRAMEAMLEMRKIDIKALEKAYNKQPAGAKR